jgi:prepilin-type N-terminal cleavage/methylation domain-containing protein
MFKKVVKSKKNQDGYSLIEVLVTMVVLSILIVAAGAATLKMRENQINSLMVKTVQSNVDIVSRFFVNNPYALVDSKSPGCETGLVKTPGLLPVTASNNMCVSITGNAEDYIVRASFTGIESYYEYRSAEMLYEKVVE